jgi:hypothetical protein
MTTALFMLVIAGVAMGTVGALLATDVRRTLNGSADAQLRQLLIAAEIDATLHLAHPIPETWTTPIPPSLAALGTVRTRRTSSADGLELSTTATLAGRSLVQELRFKQTANGWQLVEATLDPAMVQH